MKKGLISLLAAVLFCLLLPCAAFAAQEPVHVPLEITTWARSASSSETFTIRITAEDGAPLPNGEAYEDVEIKGSQTTRPLTLTFTHAGIYKYTAAEVAGDTANCVYDQSVYAITVTVTNSEDGRSLSSQMSVRLQSTGAKTDDFAFTHKYPSNPGDDDPTPTPTPPDTPPDTTPDTTPPDGGTPTPGTTPPGGGTPTPGTTPPGGGTPTPGTTPPDGSTPTPGSTPPDGTSPSPDGSTPSGEKLPQTGMLWTPVILLAAAGTVFVLLGVQIERKSRKDRNA